MQKDSLYSNSAIIAPRALWGRYLDMMASQPGLDIKLFDLSSLQDEFSRRIDPSAIGRLLDEGISYRKAKALLDCLPLLDERKARKAQRLNEVCRLFDLLKSEGYIHEPFLPGARLKGRNIIISGYGSGVRVSGLVKELPNIAMGFDLGEGLGDDLLDPKAAFGYSLHRFPTYIEGFHYLGNLLCRLIAEQGVKPSDICLCNYEDGDRRALLEISRLYGLPINLPASIPLAYLDEGKAALRFIAACGLSGREGLLSLEEELESAFPNSDKVGMIVEALSPLCRNSKLSDIRRACYLRLKEELTGGVTYEDGINVARGYFCESGQYGILLDFSSSHAPKPGADNPFLLEEEDYEAAGLLTPQEAGHLDACDLLSALRHGYIKDAFFYMQGTDDRPRHESFLMAEEMAKAASHGVSIAHDEGPLDYEYSKGFARIEYGDDLESEKKFLSKLPRQDALSEMLPGFALYDPRFDKNNRAFAAEKLQKASYTALETYAKCPYMYYLQYILGLRDDSHSFPALQGTYFHAIFEEIGHHGYDTSFFESGKQEAERIIGEGGESFSYSERLLLSFTEEEARVSADNYAKRLRLFPLRPEIKLEADLGGRKLYGRSDLVGEVGDEVFVVDYKTSGWNHRFELPKIPLGLSMQLPLYSLLASSTLGKEVYGAFIASIKCNIEDHADVADSPAALEGFVKSDPSLLGKFDPDLEIISHSAKGEVKGAFDDETIKLIIEQAREKAEQEMDAIEESKFPISPIKVKNGEDGCKYCSFAIICHADPDFARYYRKRKGEDGAVSYEQIGKFEYEEDDEDEAD